MKSGGDRGAPPATFRFVGLRSGKNLRALGAERIDFVEVCRGLGS